MSRHIYLTGYRGTGKTTVAQRLSASIEMPWIDLDAEIVSVVGKTISDIFSESGEAAFRDWESDVLQRLADGPARIISLGGGAILRPTNRATVRQTGFCVWLDADAEQLEKRLMTDAASASQRPSLTGLSMLDEIRQVMNHRRPMYQEVADVRIDTGQLSVEQVAKRIEGLLPLDRN